METDFFLSYSRNESLGFTDKAELDEGVMWPTSYALKELNTTEEANIIAFVKKAVGIVW